MPAKVRLPRSVPRAEIASLPHRVRLPEMHLRAAVGRLAPTRRSLAIGFGILAFGLGAYVLARETSLFAISRIEVDGASPRVAAQVRRALGPLVGRSLVGLDGATVVRTVDALPTVVRTSVDRAFPHTLRISVVPERPVAVLRRGVESWLVSARGRVIERLPSRAILALPRVWVSGRTPVGVGAELDVTQAGAAARAVGLSGAFGSRIASASFAGGSLVFRLRSGLEILLGDRAEIGLKLAVAERALADVPPGSSFLDVSVPGRAVSGTASSPQGSSRG